MHAACKNTYFPNAIPLPGTNSWIPAGIQSTKNNLLPFHQNPAFTKAGNSSYIFSDLDRRQ